MQNNMLMEITIKMLLILTTGNFYHNNIQKYTGESLYTFYFLKNKVYNNEKNIIDFIIF